MKTNGLTTQEHLKMPQCGRILLRIICLISMVAAFAGAAVVRQGAGSVTKPILRTPARCAADIACATRS